MTCFISCFLKNYDQIIFKVVASLPAAYIIINRDDSDHREGFVGRASLSCW